MLDRVRTERHRAAVRCAGGRQGPWCHSRALSGALAFLVAAVSFLVTGLPGGGVSWQRPAYAHGNTITVPDATESVGEYTALALDAAGNPVVSYYDFTNRDLKLVHCRDANCAGGKSIVTLDDAGDVGRYTSLALDAAGNPVVSYYDAISGALKLAHCNDADCTGGGESIVTVDDAGDVGELSSLALDADGNPVVSYYDATSGALKLAHCNDANCTGGDESIVVVDTAGVVGTFSSLALDAAGNPVVSYYDFTNSALKLVHCDDPYCADGDESIVTVDETFDVGRYTSLALDADGNPVVSYYDASFRALKLVHCDDPYCAGGGESIVTLDDAADVGQFNSLALDTDGNPVVSYLDATNFALKLARCNDPNCSGSTSVITLDNEGWYTSLALDTEGNPVVSYHDTVSDDLKLLHCAHPSCTNASPLAEDDAYTVAGSSLSVPAPGILANDTDPDGDPLTPQLVIGVGHGTLTLNANGSFEYEPDPGFVGEDRFAYTADDGEFVEGAIVTLTVPAEATQLTLGASAGSVMPGGTVTVSGAVYDDQGFGISAAVVELSADAGLLPPQVVTDDTGAFSTVYTAPAAAGPVTLTATVAGTTVQTVLTLPVTAGQAASLTLGVSPSTVAAGGQATVSGRVQDDEGNPIAVTAVTLAATAGTVTESVYTDAHGDYTATFTAPGAAGPVLVTAEVSVASADLTAAAVVAVTDPAGAAAGATGGYSEGGHPLALGGTGSPTPELTLTGTGGDGAGALIAYTANPAGDAPPGTTPVFFDAAVVTGHGFAQVTLQRCGFTAGSNPTAYWWDGAAWRKVSPQARTGDCVVLGPLRATGTSPTLAELTGTPFAVALATGSGSGGGSGGGQQTLARPVISDVRPNVGPVTGGTRVALSGQHFRGVTAVHFGEVPALRFALDSDDRLTVLAPPGTGTVEITVTTPAGPSSATAALRFTYLPQPAASFVDLPQGHWAYAGVQLLAEMGVATGDPGGRFRPAAPVTRAEFVVLLTRMLGLAPVASGSTPFADVHADAWYAPPIAAAVAAGIAQGVSPAGFAPDDPVTREQAAVLLARALGLEGTADLTAFSDAAAVSPWARAGVEAALAAGLLQGFPDKTLGLRQFMARAEAAVMLARMWAGGS